MARPKKDQLSEDPAVAMRQLARQLAERSIVTQALTRYIEQVLEAVNDDVIQPLRDEIERLKAPSDEQIDALAYRFWSVHPKELDEWVKTDPHPPMPERYPGGVRAWFFACEMRKLMQRVATGD